MAHDEGLAEILRGDLAGEDGISEKRMFGGLALLKDGHMLAGIHGAGGAMFRVGKDAEAQAMAIEGASPMTMTGRKMGGWVDVKDPADVADDARRSQWLGMALTFVKSLPPK